MSSMLISPWDIPILDFQPGWSPLLFNPYFSSDTRLRKRSGAFPLQESPWLRQAPPPPSVAWGRSKAGSPGGASCSSAVPPGVLSSLLGSDGTVQGLGQGLPFSATLSAEYAALAIPRWTRWKLKLCNSSRCYLERFLFENVAWGRRSLQVMGTSPLAEVLMSSLHFSSQVNCNGRIKHCLIIELLCFPKTCSIYVSENYSLHLMKSVQSSS